MSLKKYTLLACLGLVLTAGLSAVNAPAAMAAGTASGAGAGAGAGANDVNAMIADALNLLRSNRNAEAASELKRALEIAPNSAEAHHNLGLALAKLGDMDGAIAQVKRATELKPELDASWLTLGGLQQSSGRIDEAIKTYKQFLQLFENRADRTDLNDTVAKVHKLLDALNVESKTIQSYKNGTEAIRSGLLQTPAQAVTNDDYVAEATRNGIVRWPSSRMPIRVYIHQADPRRDPNYKPRWNEILVQSFNDWTAASKGRVTFKFVDQCGAGLSDIECTFVPNPTRDAGGLSADAEAGEAQMYVDSEGIKSGNIKLLTASMSSVLPLNDNRMRVTCLHEIGHALGLAGHTTNPDDIMFYSTSFKDEWRNLSGRDARTIQRLYAPN